MGTSSRKDFAARVRELAADDPVLASLSEALLSVIEVMSQEVERLTKRVLGQQAQEATGRTALTVLADRGYFSGRQIVACEKAGMMPYVPKPYTSGAKAEGRFGKQDFVYVPGENVYRCPAGERLTWRFDSIENGMTLHSYWTDGCGTCALKPDYTTSQQRRIKRWEHEGVLDAMQKRLDQVLQAMILRRQTVEHPFGTIKAWMGSTHFLTRTLKRVSTEISLQVLAYNMKRVIAILGFLGSCPSTWCSSGGTEQR